MKRSASLEIIPLVVKRSSASIGILAMVVVLGLHIGLRSFDWRYEWALVFDSYHFSTVLLGPVIVGLGVLDGMRYVKARPYFLTAPKSWRITIGMIAGAALPAIGVYLLGLSLMVVVGLVGPAPGVPSVLDAASTIPAVMFLLLLITSGVAMGWRFPYSFVPPAAAIGTFGIILWCYVAAPGLFVNLGGATGSLVGLVSRPEVLVAQSVFYVAGSILITLWLAQEVAGRRTSSRLSGVPSIAVSGVAVLLAAAVLIGVGTDRFEEVPVALKCSGGNSELEICLAPGYEGFDAAIRSNYQQPLADIAAAEVIEVPARLAQNRDGSLGAESAPVYPLEIFHEFSVSNMVMNYYLPKDCDFFDPEVAKYRRIIEAWTLAASGGENYLVGDEAVPAALVENWQGDESTALVQGAATDLRAACPDS